MTEYVTIIRPSGEVLQIDALITGNFEGSANITDHPIEDGSRISDHSDPEPLRITAEIRQSETPLEIVTGPFGAARIRETMRFFEEAGRGGESLTLIVPRIGEFDDLLLASWPNEITVRKDSTFQLVFQQIEQAVVTLVTVPVEAIRATSRAGQQEEEDLGRQATEPTEEREERQVPPSLLTLLVGR